MTDLAQLREALAIYQDHARSEPIALNAFPTLEAAARELLALREAGVLIITPDENVPCVICNGSGTVEVNSIPPIEITCTSCRGSRKEKWEQWVIDVIANAEGYMGAVTSGRFGGNYRAFLDALRDAMPPEDSE